MTGWACRQCTFPYHKISMAEANERDAMLRQVERNGPPLNSKQRCRLRELIGRAINLAPAE